MNGAALVRRAAQPFAPGAVWPLAASLLAAALLAGGAVAAPATLPVQGILVPGQSLGGVRLGMTAAAVRARFGSDFGRCRSCAHETWYYGYKKLEPKGLGVELQHGRVSAVFTMWSPDGWRSREGVALGAPAAQVAATYGTLLRRECDGYSALVLPGRRATTAVMIVDERVWGFILATPRSPVCR